MGGRKHQYGMGKSNFNSRQGSIDESLTTFSNTKKESLPQRKPPVPTFQRSQHNKTPLGSEKHESQNQNYSTTDQKKNNSNVTPSSKNQFNRKATPTGHSSQLTP